MSEKAVVKAIMTYLQGLEGCFVWKEHGGMYGTAGLPDIICCYKGRFVGIEVKKPGGKLTKLQEITLRDIERAGGIAKQVTTVEEIKALFEELKGENRDEYKM